jgi:hypothetical protein
MSLIGVLLYWQFEQPPAPQPPCPQLLTPQLPSAKPKKLFNDPSAPPLHELEPRPHIGDPPQPAWAQLRFGWGTETESFPLSQPRLLPQLPLPQSVALAQPTPQAELLK